MIIAMLVAGYYYAIATDARKTVLTTGLKIAVVDGDSFTIGPRKLRLDGVDAPEYHQSCTDAAGAPWPCGKVARAALEKLLLEPDLSCQAEVRDRYARSIATCRTAHTSDIAATQVRDGLAVSHDFNGMRSYSEEEDAARTAKRGLWRGDFELPAEWRKAHVRLAP